MFLIYKKSKFMKIIIFIFKHTLDFNSIINANILPSSRFLQTKIILIPFSANFLAVSKPIPLFAPVINATFSIANLHLKVLKSDQILHEKGQEII